MECTLGMQLGVVIVLPKNQMMIKALKSQKYTNDLIFLLLISYSACEAKIASIGGLLLERFYGDEGLIHGQAQRCGV